MSNLEQIRDNLEDVEGQIAQALKRVGRSRNELQLVVVTKTHPFDRILELYKLGLRHFGENRVEEAIEKINTLSSLPELSGVQWHLIGHVQSRKAAKVPGNFALLHSLDSVKLAKRLNSFAALQGQVVPVLLQMNTSGEASKSGFRAYEPTRWPLLYPEIEEILALDFIEVKGLMTMAPYDRNQEKARPVFKALRVLRDELQKRFSAAHFKELSMGMSSDFVAAVEEGATILRIGSSILGTRD